MHLRAKGLTNESTKQNKFCVYKYVKINIEIVSTLNIYRDYQSILRAMHLIE